MNQKDVPELRSTFRMNLSLDEAQNMPYLTVKQGVDTIDITGHDSVTGFEGYSAWPHKYEEMILDGGMLVVDQAADLMWHQWGISKAVSKRDAKTLLFLTNLDSYAGFSDWRFPTLEEAATLLERQGINEGLKIDPVFASQQSRIWTGDTCENLSESYPWYVDFKRGVLGLGREHDEIFLRPVRSIQTAAKSFNFRHELEAIAEDILGREIRPHERDVIYVTEIKNMAKNPILNARGSYELEKYFKRQNEELRRRGLNLIERHSENFEKLAGRPLNEIEVFHLCDIKYLETLNDKFEKIFSASNPEDALEDEIGWKKREPYAPSYFYANAPWMGKKLFGQKWAFSPAGKMVQAVHNDEEDIERRALQFWESFEKLKPLIVQILIETLPEMEKDQGEADCFAHLDSIYFFGKLTRYLNHFASDSDGDPGVELCFQFGKKGYLVGVKEGSVAYVDQRNFKTGKSLKRLWGIGEESVDAQQKRKAAKRKARPKWKIEKVTLRTRDSYFESDVTYEFRVVNNKTKKVFASFHRSEYSDDRGDQNSGCRSVVFSEDGKSVVATNEDGEKEKLELPD